MYVYHKCQLCFISSEVTKKPKYKYKKMENHNLNIILANAPIVDINRGCVALTLSSLYLIDTVCKKNNISYRIFLPNSNLPPEQKYSIKYGEDKLDFFSCAYPEGPSIIVSLKMRLSMMYHGQYKQAVKRIKDADYIFDIGLGDSFSDIYGRERFEWMDLIHRLARKYKKKYYFLPQTIGPFKVKKNENKAKKSLLKSSLVMVRDRKSYDYVRQLCQEQKKIHEYIDIAFFLPYTKHNFEKGYIHVGINISALLWIDANEGSNIYDLKINYRKLILDIIKYFQSQCNVKIYLVPHVVAGERFTESDYTVCYDLWKELNNPKVLLAPYFLGPIEAKSYISGFDFFIGARMHATIAAFSSGVPVLPMAYSRKFNGLFCDTLKYQHILDMKVSMEESALEIVCRSFENRYKLKEEINECIKTTVSKRKEKILSDLQTILK